MGVGDNGNSTVEFTHRVLMIHTLTSFCWLDLLFSEHFHTFKLVWFWFTGTGFIGCKASSWCLSVSHVVRMTRRSVALVLLLCRSVWGTVWVGQGARVRRSKDVKHRPGVCLSHVVRMTHRWVALMRLLCRSVRDAVWVSQGAHICRSQDVKHRPGVCLSHVVRMTRRWVALMQLLCRSVRDAVWVGQGASVRCSQDVSGSEWLCAVHHRAIPLHRRQDIHRRVRATGRLRWLHRAGGATQARQNASSTDCWRSARLRGH